MRWNAATQRNAIPTVKYASAQSTDPMNEMMIRFRMPVVVIAHGVIFSLALLSAFLLAYNFRLVIGQDELAYRWFVELFVPLLVLALPIKLAAFYWVGQYQGSWRYVGLRDLLGVIRASLVSSFFFLLIYFMLENLWRTRLIDVSPSEHLKQSTVFVLDWACTVIFVSAARILVRFYYEDIQPKRPTTSNRVLIVGASDAGEAVLRELLRVRGERYECIGFLDDEVPHLHGRIHDVEILGRTIDIREICADYEVQEIFMALPHVTPKTMRTLVERCQGMGVTFRTIPAMTDVIEGRVQVSRMRDVDIADLLGREPVELETDMIAHLLHGEVALVTGAGGSIGSEMCRQIAGFAPKSLILVERAENGLFEIDRELRLDFPEIKVVPYVADIADPSRIRSILTRQRPSVVFHAAAHKHVPMMEINPGEAIKNNIGGTKVLADAVMAAGVARMVVISTDKAVNPTSLMGCSKRVGEMYVQSAGAGSGTHFITVRFGNVLGSSGSVVPIFRQQIAAGGPVTVTHPEMQRYFMTITEAAQLVLQAGAMGNGGEIFVLHMGEPVKIVDLARDMITLSGLRPEVDIEIEFTGIRPGEKLFEELSTEGEHIGDTAHPKIGIWKHRTDDAETVRRGAMRLIERADTASSSEIQEELKRLVPEYIPDTTVAERTTADAGIPADRGVTPQLPTP